MKLNNYIFIILLFLQISNTFIITPPLLHIKKNNIVKLQLKKDFFNDFPIVKNNTNIIKKNEKEYDDYNIIDQYIINIFLYSIFTYITLIYYFSNGSII